MSRSFSAVSLAAAVVVAAAVAGCRRNETDLSAFAPWSEASAWGLGRQIRRDLPSGGTVLLVSANMDDEVFRALMEARLSGLRKGAAEGEGNRLEFKLLLPGNPVSDLLAIREAYVNLPRAIPALLEEHPGTVAVVVAGPSFTWSRPPQPSGLPPLYALDEAGSPDWKTLVEGKVLNAVVAPRDHLEPAGDPGRRSPKDLFEERFQLLQRSIP